MKPASRAGGQRIIVSFCCNGDQGIPLGKATACHIEDLELQDTLIGGGEVKIRHEGEVLHVGRLSVGFLWYKPYFGNWYWDGYAVPPESAVAIVNYLMKRKWWHCEGGECNAFEKFNARQPLTLDELLKAVA
jgi:hypothetical protein